MITISVMIVVFVAVPPPFIAPSLIVIAIMPGIHVVFAVMGLKIALFVSAAPSMPTVIAIPITVGISECRISKR